MRIISGKNRGRKLSAPILSEDIKPTTDRAKEAIFNMLFEKVKDCVFIDMFAGSGQMGIEAMSRGAKKVIFIDNNPQSISCIKENVKGINGDFEIMNMNFDKALKTMNKHGKKADIAYCDPPYDLKMADKILNSLHQNSIMNFGGIVLIEGEKTYPITLSKVFYHYEARSYAKSRIDFYKREKRVAITGTFDPFTNGHMDLVMKAKETFDRIYIVILINENKEIRYPLDKRKRIIETAIGDDKEKVVIDSYDGLAIDYCRENDIQYILRGVRNKKDFDYEKQMADYNYQNGGVTTILMPAKSSNISSTKVRKDIDQDKDISYMVNHNVIEILKE
ncbi:MAG: 16S rRNA (guanine(966)-N(2))-methyltransferase RsmD [Bacillota bacterium]